MELGSIAAAALLVLAPPSASARQTCGAPTPGFELAGVDGRVQCELLHEPVVPPDQCVARELVGLSRAEARGLTDRAA